MITPVLSSGFYQIDNLPWEPHIFDPQGVSIVFVEVGQSFYSIAHNRYTKGLYRVYRTGPKGDSHRFWLPRNEIERFLASFAEGSLVFWDDAYAERRSWRVAE